MDSPQGKQEVCARLSVWQKWWRHQSTCHHFRNTVLHITHRILCIDQLNLKNCISHNRRAKLLYVFAITSDLHFCPLLEASFYWQFGSHCEWAALSEEALHSSGPDDAAEALSTAGWFTCLSTTWSEHSVELKTVSVVVLSLAFTSDTRCKIFRCKIAETLTMSSIQINLKLVQSTKPVTSMWTSLLVSTIFESFIKFYSIIYCEPTDVFIWGHDPPWKLHISFWIGIFNNFFWA